jgi:hypothetical protein
VPARLNSPWCYAALQLAIPGIVVVEAVVFPVDAPVRWTHSNVGGHISAAGVDVLCADSSPAGYDNATGTSMAAPFVAGVAGYLALLQPDLTNAEISDLLTANAQSNVTGGAQPVLDAWAAAMDIDRIREGQPVLRMLVDIDDGTLDGNQRVDPLSNGDVPDDAARGHGGFGDGEVDIKDFRAFRDALIQVEASPLLALDGSVSHPKFDLNGDGVVDSDPAKENIYPRADFNGDGKIDYDTFEHVPGVIDAAVSDLQVLEAVFSDPHVDASELDGLLDSGDLEVDASVLFGAAGASSVQVEVRNEATQALVAQRTQDAEAPRVVITLPSGQE